jgi:hypothetical protein
MEKPVRSSERIVQCSPATRRATSPPRGPRQSTNVRAYDLVAPSGGCTKSSPHPIVQRGCANLNDLQIRIFFPPSNCAAALPVALLLVCSSINYNQARQVPFETMPTAHQHPDLILDDNRTCSGLCPQPCHYLYIEFQFSVLG